MFRYLLTGSMLCLGACVSTSAVRPSSFMGGLNTSADVAQAAQVDLMLSWIGGLSTVAGIVALVLTRGSMGLRAVVIGIGLVLLNQAIARYGDFLFLPTITATGAVSVAYAYITIRRLLRHRKENGT
jgi:hypothetical protein